MWVSKHERGWEGYVDGSGNRDIQLASRNVLRDFTNDTLAISAGSSLQNGTSRTLKTCWRCWVWYIYWWNLKALLGSPVRFTGRRWTSLGTMVDLEHGYLISTDRTMGKREMTKLLKSCLIRNMTNALGELQSNLLHLFHCFGVVGWDRWGCLNSIFKM